MNVNKLTEALQCIGSQTGPRPHLDVFQLLWLRFVLPSGLNRCHASLFLLGKYIAEVSETNIRLGETVGGF